MTTFFPGLSKRAVYCQIPTSFLAINCLLSWFAWFAEIKFPTGLLWFPILISVVVSFVLFRPYICRDLKNHWEVWATNFANLALMIVLFASVHAHLGICCEDVSGLQQKDATMAVTTSLLIEGEEPKSLTASVSPITVEELTHDWKTAVYFSVVTFTTLGYGDYLPTKDGQPVVALQAIYGYVYLGLLVGMALFWAQTSRSEPAFDDDDDDISPMGEVTIEINGARRVFTIKGEVEDHDPAP